MLDRRKFMAFIPASIAAFGISELAAPPQARADGKHVGAIESLTRGHGLLIRSLRIYDTAVARSGKGEAVDPVLVKTTADLVLHYFHDYHEPMEEKYIFGPLELHKKCFSSIQVLKMQHGTSYELNQRISKLAGSGKLTPEALGYMSGFSKMYTHHSSWEDTVIFPAFDAEEKRSDIDSLAETFANEERKILGSDAFESFLGKIADVEKQLNIYDLAASTANLS
jgi:hemerythrin-like domain-containing protein